MLSVILSVHMSSAIAHAGHTMLSISQVLIPILYAVHTCIYTMYMLSLLCCFALFVCLTLLTSFFLPSFFLPSHLSLKHVYICT